MEIIKIIGLIIIAIVALLLALFIIHAVLLWFRIRRTLFKMLQDPYDKVQRT